MSNPFWFEGDNLNDVPNDAFNDEPTLFAHEWLDEPGGAEPIPLDEVIGWNPAHITWADRNAANNEHFYQVLAARLEPYTAAWERRRAFLNAQGGGRGLIPSRMPADAANRIIEEVLEQMKQEGIVLLNED